jgi:HD-GYP domain-containing protein (c-di-GMP phosphodiesterase class II)
MTKTRMADLYIWAVVLGGTVCFVLNSLSVKPASSLDPVMFVFLLALAGIAQRNPVRLFRSSAISVAFAVKIAAYVLFGVGVALWANLAVVGVNAVTPSPKPARKVLFNFGQLSLATYAAATTYRLVGGEVPPGAVVPTIVAVAFSGAVYFLAGSVMTAIVIALTSNASFYDTWRKNFSWMPVNYIATAINGAALALAYQSMGLFGALVFVLPLGIAWYSFKLYMSKSTEVRARVSELQTTNEALARTNQRLEESHLSVIGALLGSLEAKDRYTEGHSAATMFHAVAVAKRLGLGPDEIAAVQLGALFHDIGKIGVPDGILRKPDRLTDEEWVEMRLHPLIGANLLAHVPNLEKVRPIVLAHHERYDGRGYPNGLSGNQIPLAAQIIAVADAYEAMTSTRPYRPAMSRELALAELHAVAGKQLSPIVVDVFMDVLSQGEGTHQEHESVYQQAVKAVSAAG